MELNHAIAALVATIEKYECTHTDDKSGWKCNLEGATDGHLTSNIPRDKKIKEPIWPPPGGPKTLASCKAGNPGVWPSQAHHLIPWKQLKPHRVTSYLAESPSEAPAKMWADNNYSVNHGNNGKFMPFASNLADWDAATDQQKVAEDLMDKVLIQLHQSRHSSTQYDGAKQGYKERVKEYLKEIADRGAKHPDQCDECKAKKNGDKWPPRAGMVAFVDKASALLEQDINDMDIFVSRRAAVWAGKRKLKLSP
jgi:hypothetical protein